MRQGIHPEYHHDTVVKCACGNTFTTGSVKPELIRHIFQIKFVFANRFLVKVSGYDEKSSYFKYIYWLWS